MLKKKWVIELSRIGYLNYITNKFLFWDRTKIHILEECCSTIKLRENK